MVCVFRMKERDSDFSQQRHEYERELKHLRLMLKEKQQVLDLMSGEKRSVLAANRRGLNVYLFDTSIC